MPRPRYPSDENRRRIKPHVRIHHSIAGHPRYGSVWRDVKLRGMLVELWRIASVQGAAHTENRVLLTPGQRTDITGIEHATRRDATLRKLCASFDYSVRVMTECGQVSRQKRQTEWLIEIRNFAKKQNLTPQLRSGALRDSAVSPLPSPHSALLKNKESSLRSDSSAVAQETAPTPTAPEEPKNGKHFPDEELLAVLQSAKTPTIRALATPKLSEWWGLILETYDGIAELYIDEQLRQMDLWLMEHPARAKRTLRGSQQFVRNWLKREEPKAIARAAAASARSRADKRWNH